jgi:hypothetical protein
MRLRKQNQRVQAAADRSGALIRGLRECFNFTAPRLRAGGMRTHHIIDSAATLLGVSLVIVTGVHISGKASTSIADELSFAAALMFLVSCGASHQSIVRSSDRLERLADNVFGVGLAILLCGVLSFWF